MRQFLASWRAWPLRLWVGMGLLLLAVTVQSLIPLYQGKLHLNDFHSFYVGSVVYWAGENPYDTPGAFVQTADDLGLSFVVGTGYSYPPLLAFLSYPLTLLSFDAAVRLFVMLSILAYLGFAAWLLRRLLDQPKGLWWSCVAFLATFQPVIKTFESGQANIWLLWLLTLYLAYPRRDRLAGIMLTLAAYLKVYPVLLLLRDALLGRKRLVITTLLCGLSIGLLLLIPTQWSVMTDYLFRFLPSLNGNYDTYYSNQSMNGFLSRLLNTAPGNFALSRPDFKLLLYALTAASLGGMSYLTWRLRSRAQAQTALALLWLGVVTLLAGKNSFWNFTPTVLIGVYLMTQWPRLKLITRITLVASVLITNVGWYLVWPAANPAHFPQSLTEQLSFVLGGSLGFLALLSWVAMLLWLLLSGRATAEPAIAGPTQPDEPLPPTGAPDSAATR